MTQDEKRDIALMRYSTIAPLISGNTDMYQSMEAYYRAASEKDYFLNGETKRFSSSSIKKWHTLYRHGGFDALMPTDRSDSGHTRCLDDDSQEMIRHLKKNYPRMPATSIYQELLAKGVITKTSVSESSVNRFVNHLMAEEKITSNTDRRRYECPHINDVWCGDSSVGPRLITPDGKKKLYIIALIDDASRFIVGIDIFFNDNYVNLMSVIRSAVSKYGRPKLFNFDNGSSYRNKQMELLAGRIGSVVHYCHPYSPTEKAKIERWFRTMKDKWMANLDMRDYSSIDEVRDSLFSFVDTYNHTVHSSLSGRTPFDRFFSEPEYIRRLSKQDIDASFLLEIERTVSADSVINIDCTEYEVNYRYAGQRIRLRYSPDMADIFVVNHDGSLTPIRLLDKKANSSVRREKVHLSEGDT